MGPILSQELHPVPQHCTADMLGAALACKGARLVSEGPRVQPELLVLVSGVLTRPLCLCPSLQLMETLGTLSDKAAHQKEQSKIGATFGT